MPVRERVTIRFDGNATDFFATSRAVRAEIQALERDINAVSERFNETQRRQAELGDGIVRRQQEQAQALRNSLEAQRLAYIQIGASQQSTIRRNNEIIAQHNELVRLGKEQLDLDQQRVATYGDLNTQMEGAFQKQREYIQFLRSGQAEGPKIDFSAEGTAFFNDLNDSQQRSIDSTQRLKEILDGVPGTLRSSEDAADDLYRALNRTSTTADELDGLVKQLNIAQQYELDVISQEQVNRIKLFREGLDLSSRSLRNMLYSVTQLSLNLLKVYVITGLIAALLVSFETLAGIVGIIAVSFGAFATIRQQRDLRAFRNEVDLATEDAQRLVAANRQVGLSIRETHEGIQAIASGIRRAIAEPLGAEATELRLLGLHFQESDLQGQNLTNTIIRLDEALTSLSAADAAERVAALTQENDAAQRILERGSLARRLASTEQIRIIRIEEEAYIDAIQERFALSFTVFYSRLRGFIADNGAAIAQIIGQVETFLLPVAQVVLDFLTEYIARLNANIPSIISALENAWPHVIETIDQIVLRLEQFASVFTSFGLSGPQVVDVLALLVAVNLISGVLGPLVGTIRSITFFFRGLFDAVRGLPAVLTRVVNIFSGLPSLVARAAPHVLSGASAAASSPAVRLAFLGTGVGAAIVSVGGLLQNAFSQVYERISREIAEARARAAAPEIQVQAEREEPGFFSRLIEKIDRFISVSEAGATTGPDLGTQVVEALRREEGFRGRPYQDAEGLSIGYGTFLPLSVQELQRLSQSRGLGDQAIALNDLLPLQEREARVLLESRLNSYIEDLRRAAAQEKGVDVEELPEQARNALFQMVYQLGVRGLLDFNDTWTAIAARDWAETAAEALDSQWAREDSPARARRVAALFESLAQARDDSSTAQAELDRILGILRSELQEVSIDIRRGFRPLPGETEFADDLRLDQIRAQLAQQTDSFWDVQLDGMREAVDREKAVFDQRRQRAAAILSELERPGTESDSLFRFPDESVLSEGENYLETVHTLSRRLETLLFGRPFFEIIGGWIGSFTDYAGRIFVFVGEANRIIADFFLSLVAQLFRPLTDLFVQNEERLRAFGSSLFRFGDLVTGGALSRIPQALDFVSQTFDRIFNFFAELGQTQGQLQGNRLAFLGDIFQAIDDLISFAVFRDIEADILNESYQRIVGLEEQMESRIKSLQQDTDRARTDDLNIDSFERLLEVSGRDRAYFEDFIRRAEEEARRGGTASEAFLQEYEGIRLNYNTTLQDIIRLLREESEAVDKRRAETLQAFERAYFRDLGIDTYQDFLDVSGRNRAQDEELIRRSREQFLAVREDPTAVFDPNLSSELEQLRRQYGVGLEDIINLRQREQQEIERQRVQKERELEREEEARQREREQARQRVLDTIEQTNQTRRQIETYEDFERVVRERFGLSSGQITDLYFGALAAGDGLTEQMQKRLEEIEGFTGVGFEQVFVLLEEMFNRMADQAVGIAENNPFLGESIPIEDTERQLDTYRRIRVAEVELGLERERNGRIAEVARRALTNFTQILSDLVTGALFEEDFSFQDRLRDYFRSLSSQILNAILNELIQPLLRDLDVFGQNPIARDQQGNLTQRLIRTAFPAVVEVGTSAATARFGSPKRTVPVIDLTQNFIGYDPNQVGGAARRGANLGSREALREVVSTAGGREILAQTREEEEDD